MENVMDDISEHFLALTRKDEFSGVVLIARQGDILLELACGTADRERGIPIRVDTRFNLSSLGKPFTSVAVMQLVERGELGVDDRLADLWPELVACGEAEHIRVHHLLTHSSGVQMEGGSLSSLIESGTIGEALGRLPIRSLAFEPGTDWSYSNFGYLILGGLIERLSGRTYYDYLDEHVFGPAGMRATGFPRRAEFGARDDLAIPYAISFVRGVPSGPRAESAGRLIERGGAFGGGASNAPDLHRFVCALLDGRLLERETAEAMLAGRVDAPRSLARPELGLYRHGYGFSEDFLENVQFFGYAGGGMGISHEIRLYPASGYITVVMCNYDVQAETYDYLARQLLRAMRS
jgi:CubicO group peptidase (beta-lactamase class C family)